MMYNKYAFDVPPQKEIRVLIDTDAKNEADDQYAIVHALLSPRFDIRGIIAAHFGNDKSPHSMLDSYEEILRVLERMNLPDHGLVYQGAAEAMTDERQPQPSPGALRIIEEALSDDPRPLYVMVLGAITDLASAYLMEPRIAGRFTAIWIGGGAYPAGGTEYNLKNDIAAANVVMKSPMPLWQVPRDVYMMVRVSLAELEYRVRPQGKIGRYLFDQLVEDSHRPYALRVPIRTGEVWFLGDSPAVALALWEQSYDFDWKPAPEISRDMAYIHTGLNRPIRVYRSVDTRFLLEDFYAKLALFAQKEEAQ